MRYGFFNKTQLNSFYPPTIEGMKRCYVPKTLIAFVCFFVSLCSISVLILSLFKLPDISPSNNQLGFNRLHREVKSNKNREIGKFGEMMIEMLPQDLAFTAFVPSETAFKRDLGLKLNASLGKEKLNDTYAIISRILGFSVVPRAISSGNIRISEEVCYDSLSGFKLLISKDGDGIMVVNRVRGERLDLKRGMIVVHVMDGVIMDAEFEQSVGPDYNEHEEEEEEKYVK